MRKNINRLVLVGFENEYALEDANELSEVYNVHLLNINSFHARFFRMLLKFSKLIGEKYIDRIIGGELHKIRLSSNDVIIMYDNSYSYVCANNRYTYGVRKIFMYRNIITSKNLYAFSNDVEVYTFDRKDSLKFGLKLNGLFCSPASYLSKMKSNNSVRGNVAYFLGLNKGRKEWLEKFKNDNKSLNCQFIIFEANDKWIFNLYSALGEGKSQFIKYKSHLDNLMACDLVIDFIQDKQSTVSLRTMEALFANKKIVTNSKEVKNYEFYSPERFFIIDDFSESTKVPAEFLNGKIEPLACLDKYTPMYVFNSIIK